MNTVNEYFNAAATITPNHRSYGLVFESALIAFMQIQILMEILIFQNKFIFIHLFSLYRNLTILCIFLYFLLFFYLH